jgi:hypothetical protein
LSIEKYLKEGRNIMTLINQHYKLLLVLLLSLGLAVIGAGTAIAETAEADVAATEEENLSGPLIGPRAELVLKAMSDYMKSVKQFSFRGKISFDDVLPTGQKIQYSAENQVAIRRPDRVYAEMQGDTGKRRFWFDGKRATLVDGGLGVYTTVDDVPIELGAMMDHLMEKYDFSPPLADLVYPDIYEALIDNVQFGIYVGLHDVEGVRCHHLAFVTKYIDWQIWIEDGLQMVPRKVVITYKALPESPQYTGILTDWDLNARFSDILFDVEMAALANLEKIEFLTRVELVEKDNEKEVGHEADK